MILIALGSNLDGPWGSPRQTIEKACAALDGFPLRLKKISSLIETAPFGRKNQPRFVNAVAIVETAMSPDALLRKLHMIERKAGRQRRLRWGPRTLDLDIIAYHAQSRARLSGDMKPLILPHPGVADRDFVLLPIAEIAPHWRHPVNFKSALQMLAALKRD
jgi:2-amino-4-hydroxy-6-hydroxymethyldihydropteridine diphosphokinase